MLYVWIHLSLFVYTGISICIYNAYYNPRLVTRFRGSMERLAWYFVYQGRQRYNIHKRHPLRETQQQQFASENNKKELKFIWMSVCKESRLFTAWLNHFLQGKVFFLFVFFVYVTNFFLWFFSLWSKQKDQNIWNEMRKKNSSLIIGFYSCGNCHAHYWKP